MAISIPYVPPLANPRFQPKYIPEITYPTPNAHSKTGVSDFFNWASFIPKITAYYSYSPQVASRDFWAPGNENLQSLPNE